MKKTLLLALAAAASCAASAALPTTTGWYKIQFVSGTSSPDETELINSDTESRQRANTSYALHFGTTDENKPAKSFIHVTVSGNTNKTYQFTSINGHGIQETAVSSRSPLPPSNPTLTASGDNVQIGHWAPYTISGVECVAKLGNQNNTFSMTPVSDEELANYDIWTVYIALPNASEIKNDAQIAYNNENNKGITSVYNGGTFFVTEGTTISESDLSVVNCDINYTIEIDNEEHTITVTKQSDVTTGKYIRIGAKSEGYYYDMTPGGDPCFSQDVNTAIYYYDSNRRLVHYGEGRAAITDPTSTSYLRESTTAAQNANFLANTHLINFISCTNAAAADRYFVTWIYTTQKPYGLLYCWQEGSNYAVGTIGNGSIDTYSGLQNLAAGNQNWTFSVEDVTELPVKIGADSKGTMIVPVAVTVPASDDFTFYTASTNAEDKLVFSAVNAGATIPANTNIVIKRASSCSAETCNVTIATTAEAEPAALAETSERFIGSYLATVAPTPAEGEVIYVKSSTETAGDNDVVFSKVAEGDVIPAGALAFKAKNTSTDAEAPATLSLSLTAENPGTTTAINSIFVENEPANGAIYDLQGRRLSAPVKGINIIGGRKVLVK